ncbi:MAG: BREX-1 system adenine-specific DNA-methyltransferase PglX [Actinobacteria bacterium]|nr:BREX-1 system adenine-specific DNA-methyltransferase PglX [Actinomycetota bacterium]
METSPLKSFGTWARRELITQVSARLTAVLAPASPERVENQRAVTMLERDIAAGGGGAKGKDAVADKVAYTWFNRIIALRFMDANGYTSAGVVSPAHGQQTGQPEILADAKRGSIDPAVVSNKRTLDAITELLDGTRPSADAQGEAYTLLLAEYCRYWNRSMPFMFEREGDYTELLIPANLLADDSVLSRSVQLLTEDVCQNVEVIGWLYQFYISERKDEVFAGFKKNKKAGADEIPAATQLFTPHWIVRYLVENSIGRLWMLNHPLSRLAEQMDYYIEPVDEESDFLKVASPKELTVIDPACGSGHMLTYAFDLLYAIYEEEGYAPSEIPSLILTHNLHGTEIDPRAGALAAFALTMKAAAKRKLFLKVPVEPRVSVIAPISFSQEELDDLWTFWGGEDASDPRLSVEAKRHYEHERLGFDCYWRTFEHADTFGSLIQPNQEMTEAAVEMFTATNLGNDSIWTQATVAKARRVVQQAVPLQRDYAVVVANPPYMGSKQMNALLSQFMKDEYPNSKSDLFAAFIERCTNLAGARGTVAMITMQSWMFLSSYERLRASLLTKQRITSMLHLGARAFDSVGGEVVSSTAFVLVNMSPEGLGATSKLGGTFIRLVDGTSEAEKLAALSTALKVRTKEAGLHFASDTDFAAIPGSPIVYWLSEKMRAAFKTGRPLGDIAEPNQGLITADNDRFLRQWWEVSRNRTGLSCQARAEASETRRRWFPYNKGGDFRRWYGNQEYVVNWERDGAEIKAFGTDDGGRARSRPQNVDYYFKPTVSWSDISSGAPSFRRFPLGFIHGNKGNSVFGSDMLLDRLLGVMNAPCVTMILEALTPTMTASVGDVAKTPIPGALADLPTSGIEALVATAQSDWDDSEASWNFSSSPLVAAAQMSRSGTS